MKTLQWYRISRRNTDSESFVAALREVVPELSSEVFTIRSPEVRSSGSRWTANVFYDGRPVRGNETLRLVRDLLDDSRIWCELVAGDLEVHISEEATFLGVSPAKGPTLANLTDLKVTAVSSSPFTQDELDIVRYQPAIAEFWDDLNVLLESAGPLLLLSQWAGGIGGEQWFYIETASDISATRVSQVPRSILAVFDSSCYVRVDGSGPRGLQGLIGLDPLYGNLRWLSPDFRPKLSVSIVSNELELAQKCKVPARGDVLFSWPDLGTDGLVMAACPDDDGVVRTSLRFE